MRKKLIRGGVAGIAGLLVAVILWSSGLIDTWEAKTWDWRVQRMAVPGKATGEITLILLDQKSLDWASQVNALTWPWPREIYGAIVNFCKRNGARALAFDVLFTEPSTYGVEDDAAFAGAVSDFGHVAMATFLSNQNGKHSNWPADLPAPDVQFAETADWLTNASGRVRTFAKATLPIDPLASQASILCNVSLHPDPDGIFRRVDLLSGFDDKALPSLGLGAFLAAHPQTPLSFGPSHLTVGQGRIPMDAEGNVLLRYRGPSGSHRTYSAAAVLQSEIQLLSGEAPNIGDPDAFKDKYVLFGFSAPGLFDLRPSPTSGVYAGVEIYATLLDNLLSDDFMRTAPDWAVVAWLTGLALGCALLLTVLNRVASSASAIATFIAMPILLAFGAYQQGFWLPLVVQEIAVVATAGLVLMVNFATEGRQKRFIKNAFKHFLSPTVIEQLIVHPERLKLGGERRVLSIFFSDLQGFTSISENLDPERLIGLLNEYLTAMTDIIHEEGGTIDKYEGDAIIAFWNAPLEVPDHAVRAVRAALRCQAKLAEMRPAIKKRDGAELHMRIGLNTGSAVVGNLGSHTRFDYTMIGDAVNLAARLEGANKQFGTFTMISKSTFDLVQTQFQTRELARLTVVGRQEAVSVYEPMLTVDDDVHRDRLETFDQGLAAFYRGDLADAESNFARIQDHDSAAKAYARKCRESREGVGDDWQGVWVMTTK